MRLGPRAELRPLHADERPALVQLDVRGATRARLHLQALAATADEGGEALVEGVGKGNVRDDACLEEGEGPDAFGAVDDMVGDDKVARLDGLLEGADGAEGDDAADAEGAEGRDVGSCGDFVRGVLVVEAVAGEEGDGYFVGWIGG